MNILFVNACVRECSRTKRLADHLLASIDGDITEVCLENERIQPLDRESLARRDVLVSNGELEDDMLSYARQFAEAETIVIAAPYWDLAFPALLKIYFEAVTVSGVTFCYGEDGAPKGLCKAKKLIYVTTAGGPIFADFGYSYVKTMAEGFFGIEETVCFKAENLDVIGMDIEKILKETEHEIDKYTGR